MATIEKRYTKKGEEYYMIRVSRGRDSTGKQLFKKTSFHPTKKTPKAIEKEVNLFALEFEKKVLNGEYHDGENLSFLKFVDIWKDQWASRNLTQSVIEIYGLIINKHLSGTLGNKKISKITPMDIQKIINDLSDSGLKPQTVKKVYTVLRSIFNYAYAMNIVKENICDRVSLPREEANTDLHYWTPEQCDIFLENALTKTYSYDYKGHTKYLEKFDTEYYVPGFIEHRTIPFQFYCLFELAIISGARRGELLALTWKDINLESGVVYITKSLSITKEGLIVKAPKTKTSNRIVTITPKAIAHLIRWKRESQEMCIKMGTAWEGSSFDEFENNYVFIQETGSVMHPSTPTHKIKEIVTEYNKTVPKSKQLPLIKFHDLRHTSATLLINNGINPETVSKRLGHSKVSLTLDRYGHSLPSSDQLANKIVEDTFN